MILVGPANNMMLASWEVVTLFLPCALRNRLAYEGLGMPSLLGGCRLPH